MATLYTFSINIETLDIEAHIINDYEVDVGTVEDDVGYADYNEDGWGNVYAESLVSMERAEELAYAKCLDLEKKFGQCLSKILNIWGGDTLRAYTDAPFYSLNDEPYKEAPIREVNVLFYDGDKYCLVEHKGAILSVKAGYLYKEPGRFGEVEPINPKEIKNED